MKELFCFELKKLFKSTKNIVVLFLVLFLLASIALSPAFFGDPDKESVLDTFDTAIDASDLKAKEYLNSDGELSNVKKDPLKTVIKEESLLIDAKIYMMQKHYVEYMKNRVEVNNLYLSGKPEETKETHPKKADLIAQNEKFNYFLKEGITPVSDNYSHNSAFCTLRLISGLPFFLLILLVVAISSDSFTREKEKETSKLLFTQPIKTSSIIMAKFLSLWVYCTAAIVAITTIVIIASGFAFNFGDLRYLIFVDVNSFSSLFNFQSAPNLQQISIFKLLPLTIPAQIFVIAMIIAVSMLVSSFVKSSSISAFCCAALFFVSNYLVYLVPSLGNFTKYLPFAAADIPASMSINCITTAPTLTNNYYLSLLIILFTTAVSILLSALVMKRKKSY